MTRQLAHEDMSWWQRRHAQRLGLGPYYAGAILLVIGHISWPIRDVSQVQVLLAIIVLLVMMWILTRLDGWLHIGYALMCLGAAGAWVYQLFLVQQVYPDYLTVLFYWVVGVHVLGMGWWSSKLMRNRVHLEDDVRGWQEIAKNFGLGMTSRHISKRDANGNESGFLVWPRGSTKVQTVLDKREELEGAMGLPEGSLRLMKHGRQTDRVDYVSFCDDPLTEAIEWPGPAQAPNGGDLSVDVGCPVGLQEDKKVVTVLYYERDINAVVNKLFGGSQGSGKSGAMTLHIMDVSCRSDGSQWGIDMKDGMEIAPMERIMDNLACNHEELTEMVEALDAIMTYRGEENTRCGRKAWPVSPEHPLLFVWMDELHRVMGTASGRDGRTWRRCVEVMVRLATTGRALGMSINGATQNPTLEATNTSQFRDRMNQRFCFRTENQSHENYIIPSRKIDAHLIPSSQPGMCYVQDRDKWTGLPVRYYKVTDEMVEMVLNIREPGLGLDEGSRRAAMRVSPRYAARCAARYGDDIEGEGGVSADTPPPAPRDGGSVTVADFTPHVIPPLRLDGPDIRLSDLNRIAREQRATRSGQVLAMEHDEPASVEEVLESRIAASRRRVPEEVPEGEEAVFLVLANRKTLGASAKELWEAAERRKTWFHDLVPGWLEQGRIVQPEGRGGQYFLPEYADRREVR